MSQTITKLLKRPQEKQYFVIPHLFQTPLKNQSCSLEHHPWPHFFYASLHTAVAWGCQGRRVGQQWGRWEHHRINPPLTLNMYKHRENKAIT